MKNFNPNKIKIDVKSFKKVLICYIRYVMIKHSKYVKINRIDPLYFIVSKMNRYFEETNRSKCLTLVLTNESKEINEKIKRTVEQNRRFNLVHN